MSASQAGAPLILRFIRDAVLTRGHIAIAPRRVPIRYIGMPPRPVVLH